MIKELRKIKGEFFLFVFWFCVFVEEFKVFFEDSVFLDILLIL